VLVGLSVAAIAGVRSKVAFCEHPPKCRGLERAHQGLLGPVRYSSRARATGLSRGSILCAGCAQCVLLGQRGSFRVH
jgi:hypothetical protein